MTHIVIAKETKPLEARIAATADTVKKYIALGATVSVERGAGLGSAISDAAFETAGAVLIDRITEADIILKVAPPSEAEIASYPSGVMLLGALEPYTNKDKLAAYNNKNIAAFALELLPRISRAQSMDILSSQSNLAVYRAVIEAV